MLIIGKNEIDGDIDLCIRTLESLLSDLKKIASGWRPTRLDLRAVPFLNPYSFGLGQHFYIRGTTPGITDIEPGEPDVTNIWLAAPELDWVRTTYKFYRLGRPTMIDVD